MPAQQPKPAGEPATPAPAEKTDDPVAADDALGAIDTKATQQDTLEERYKDPRVDAALENSFPELFARARITTPADDRRIRGMASGQTSLDRGSLAPYVQSQVAQLTKHANIEAMLSPSSDPRLARAIEDAGSNLLQPLLAANEAKNATFRTEFTRALVAVAPDVLKNHLYARMLLMVALSRSQDPLAIPIFLRQLDDPDQVLTVKLLSAVGLTNLAQQGRQSLDPADATKSAKSLAGFLEREKETFWPAQYRAVESLGALRQSESAPRSPTSDIAASVLGLLADPQVRPEVRAEAAWALGMMRPAAQSRFNFRIVAHHMGIAAADIAEALLEVPADASARISRLADLLVLLYTGFEGDAELRAGLLRTEHANFAPQRGAVRALADRVKALATAAVELARAPKAQQEQERAGLRELVDELRSYLAQNPPDDLALYASGPTFPVERAEAAGPGDDEAGAEDADAAPKP